MGNSSSSDSEFDWDSDDDNESNIMNFVTSNSFTESASTFLSNLEAAENEQEATAAQYDFANTQLEVQSEHQTALLDFAKSSQDARELRQNRELDLVTTQAANAADLAFFKQENKASLADKALDAEYNLSMGNLDLNFTKEHNRNNAQMFVLRNLIGDGADQNFDADVVLGDGFYSSQVEGLSKRSNRKWTPRDVNLAEAAVNDKSKAALALQSVTGATSEDVANAAALPYETASATTSRVLGVPTV